MVECCEKGKTAEEMTANARKNRVFLEKVFCGNLNAPRHHCCVMNSFH